MLAQTSATLCQNKLDFSPGDTHAHKQALTRQQLINLWARLYGLLVASMRCVHFVGNLVAAGNRAVFGTERRCSTETKRRSRNCIFCLCFRTAVVVVVAARCECTGAAYVMDDVHQPEQITEHCDSSLRLERRRLCADGADVKVAYAWHYNKSHSRVNAVCVSV